MFSRPMVVKYLKHDSENDVVPDDQKPSAFEATGKNDETTSPPGTLEIDGSTLAGRFARGEPETVAAAVEPEVIASS